MLKHRYQAHFKKFLKTHKKYLGKHRCVFLIHLAHGESKASHTVTKERTWSEHSALIAIWHLNTTACNREMRRLLSEPGCSLEYTGPSLTEGRRTRQVHREDAEAPLRMPIAYQGSVLGKLNLAVALDKRLEGFTPSEIYKCCLKCAHKRVVSVSGTRQSCLKTSRPPTVEPGAVLGWGKTHK